MTAESESTDVMVFECDFDEPPEKVWRALTERELLDAWIATDDSGTPEKRGSTEYEVLAAEPHRLLRYGCRDRDSEGTGAAADQVLESTVTFELSRGPAGGTHLRLVHSDFRLTTEATCCLSPGVLRKAA